MSNVSNPRIGINLLAAGLVDAFNDRRDLIIGFVASGGSASDGVLIQNVQNLTNAELTALFGTGSLYFRIQYWRSANGGFSPLDILPIVATGAVQGTGSFQVTGTATEDGTLEFSVFDERLFTISVSIADTDTSTAIATAINTALNAIATKPWTNAVVTDTVTLTAVDESEFPNNNRMKVVGSVGGITITTLQFSAGANTNALDSSLFDAISGIRYTGINWPENEADTLDILATELESRFNVSSGVFDGVGFMGQSATAANQIIAATAQDSQVIVIGGNDVVADGPVIVQPADWTMAYFQGVRARRLTPGASIADFIVSTSGPLDNTGGPALASLPYFNTPLSLTPVTVATDQYSFSEQTSLEDGGVSFWGVNTAGNEMITGPIVTTRTTDGAGNDNDSFKYLNFVDTGSACREIIFNTLKTTFGQSRLTEGDLIPQRAMANAESIKAELLRIYRRLAGEALTQAGTEAESFFSQNTTVTVNLATRSATIAGPLPIVTQFGVATYDLQLAFTVGQTGTQITF